MTMDPKHPKHHSQFIVTICYHATRLFPDHSWYYRDIERDVVKMMSIIDSKRNSLMEL